VRGILFAGFFLGIAIWAREPARTAPKVTPKLAAGKVAIEYIEHIFDRDTGKRYATVHFATEANRTYTLQAAATVPAARWATVYVAQALPFDNHYVIADELTNQVRFYRLSVVP
jgi:hypothetical protein